MNPIFAAALEVQEFCRARGFPSASSAAWPSSDGVNPASHRTWISRSSAPLLLLLGRDGIPLDVALGAMPFEERAVCRATPFRVAEGASLMTCSAEDLIVFKAFAARDQDWIDIDGIILRQSHRLDEGLIWQELTPLLELKEDELTGARLRRLLDRPTA